MEVLKNERDIFYEIENQLFVWDKIKAEYDLSAMKRNGHPLRKKASQGEVRLINPMDIPDKEKKLAALTTGERQFIIRFIESNYTRERKHFPKS